MLLYSCTNVDELSGGEASGESPVLFSAEATSPFSRAYIPTGMYDNFKVFTTSEKDGVTTVVMNGYDVKYIAGNWTYVTDSQPLMYWDSTADRYLFTAGAPISAVSAISSEAMTLQLTNNTTESAMASEPLVVARSSADFGKTVNLRFRYAHCQVSVAFLKNAPQEASVTGITLTPDSPITSKADLTYYYDWNTPTPAVTTSINATATSSDSFSFDDVTIPAGCSDAVISASRYYCVPDANNPADWTVSLYFDGVLKSAPFQNNYEWESGKHYIYIFALDQKTPKLVTVISQDMTYFDCTDIIPGDSFSGEDMTE